MRTTEDILAPFGVIPLDDSYREDIVDVLTAAFQDDPGMRHLCGEDRERRLRRIRVLWEEGQRWQRALGEPILGVLRDGRLAGAAVINDPDASGSTLYEWRWILGLTLRLGPGLTRLNLRKNRLMDLHTPQRPQFLLHILGTLPDYRGMGCGKSLLSAISGLSEAHPRSEGVWLETENPGNVELYRHFGYDVIHEFDCAGIRGWTMFRPNGATSP